MTLTFVCQNCDDSFDVDYSAFMDNPKGLRCSSCNKKLPGPEMEELSTTLDELLGQVAALRKKVFVSFEVDAEDLPPPHDDGAKDDDDEDEDDDDAADDDEADDEDDF